MCFVAVDLGGVVEQVVLIAGLRRVICQRPIDEIVDFTDESDVIIDCTVVIGRPQQCAILAVYAPGIPLHAFMDLGAVAEFLDSCHESGVYRHERSSSPQEFIRITSLVCLRGAGPNSPPPRNRATGSRQPWVRFSAMPSKALTSFS